jgi:hypothetical protein
LSSSSASFAQTCPKSTIPVDATCIAATHATCGSYSRASSGPIMRTGSSLASARSYSARSRGTSAASVATMSLPHTSTGTPCSWQNSTIDALPALHSRAFRLPGR